MSFKLLNILVLFSFLLSSSGYKVSKHYCGDKLVDVKILMEAESCCNNDNCCQNDINYYKLNFDSISDIKKINIKKVENYVAIAKQLFNNNQIKINNETCFYYLNIHTPNNNCKKISQLQSFLL